MEILDNPDQSWVFSDQNFDRHSDKKYSIKNIRNIGEFWRNDSDKDTLVYYDSTDTFNSCDACEYLVQNINVTIAWSDSDKDTFANDDSIDTFN